MDYYTIPLTSFTAYNFLLTVSLLPLLFSYSLVSTSPTWYLNAPRLSAHHPTKSRSSSGGGTGKSRPKLPPLTSHSKSFEFFNYTQTLDHFNYRPDSFITFGQRYAIDSRYWAGPNTSAPIFAFLGEESSLDEDLEGIGFLDQHAPQLKALILFIEHRYYGKSTPFGFKEEAFRNAKKLGYFNVAQALADYAEVILYVKRKLSADSSPVVVFGASYGGMLASWFRMKYPHVAMAALASSAPILYLEDLVPKDGGYYAVVSKDFREVSQSCHDTIRQSWSEIDEIASKPDGLSHLTRKFKSCSPITDATDLKKYLRLIYAVAAQYNGAPAYDVEAICEAIDGAPKGTDVLSRVYAGVVAYAGKDAPCNFIGGFSAVESPITNGWSWQKCSDIVMPMGFGKNATMFQYEPFNLDAYMKSCQSRYGITPRPHWIATEFYGHDIKRVLKNSASNIIFSNGLVDPYSSGGILQNISNSIVAITTTKGCHCMDMSYSSSNDPKWLVRQRAAEIEIIKGWIENY